MEQERIGEIEYPVKFMAALLFGPGFDPRRELYPELETIFGHIDSESADYDFSITDYYNAEMGENLRRRMVSFAGPGEPQALVEKKLSCSSLEKKLAVDGRRSVNIDPGYLDYYKFVLASFKEGPQKIYLGSSVFADLVLMYRDGRFRILPWTFPDIREGAYMEYLGRVREIYRNERRGPGG